MNKKNILFGFVAISGLLGVGFGAFGAHALKSYLNDYQREIYNKAVLYQFIHTMAAFVALLSGVIFAQQAFRKIAVLFLIGIVCFSGSLYLLSINHLLGIPAYVLGPTTPIGGVFFILGWLYMAYCFFKIE